MPTYSAKSADMNVVHAAWDAAIKLTSDPVILLSLFETGLVESNFHNYTKATDHDSLGYLQQRPSTGWGTPAQVTNVAYATHSYITKAIAKRKAHPSYSAGQLAQSVQVSAFPDRYNQAESAARQLMTAAAKKGGINFNPFGDGGLIDTVESGASALAGGALDKVADAIRGAAAPLISTGKLADQVYKIFMPSNFLRMASGVAGAMFLLFGIYLLTKEVRNG